MAEQQAGDASDICHWLSGDILVFYIVFSCIQYNKMNNSRKRDRGKYRDIRFQSVEVGFFDVPSRTSTYNYKSLQTTVRTKSYGEHSEDEDPLPSGEISGLIEILLQFVDGIPLKRLNYLFINDSHRTRQRCFDGHGATGTKTWVSCMHNPFVL